MDTYAVHVLLVEDDADDARLFRRYIRQLAWPFCVHAVTDGDQALQWLEDQDFLPALIVLDLNLPCLNGRQVLHRIKCDPRWQAIPVAIVSGTSWERENEFCRFFGAEVFISKPYAPNDLFALAATVDPKCSTLNRPGVRRVM